MGTLVCWIAGAALQPQLASPGLLEPCSGLCTASAAWPEPRSGHLHHPLQRPTHG